MAWQLLIAVALYVVGELIRKANFPEDRESLPFEDAGIPSVDPKASKAVMWGKDTIRSPHVMDAVEYFAIPITTRVRATLFKKKDVVIGHTYYMGIQLGLGEGPVTLSRIYYDDRLLWEGTAAPADDGVAIVINEPQFLGGPEEGGGLGGTIRFFGGSATQNASAYLSGFHPANRTPAYRRVAYVQFEGFEVGENPSIEAFAFETSRYPDNLALGANQTIDGEVFNVDTNVYDTDVDSELNPAELLYELWTNTRWGMKRPISEMDTASFNAGGDIFAAELNGISLGWRNRQTNKKIAETVTRQVQSMVVFNPGTGLWELRLAREPTAPELAAAPEFSESGGITRLTNFSRITQSELITQTSIQWTDRTLSTRPPPEPAANMALYYALGSQHQSQDLNFPGVHGPTLARNIASRENKQSSFATSSIEFEVDRSAFDLLPNDIFKWAFDPLGVVQIVYRIASINPGKARLGSFKITAVQDRFSLAETIFDNQPPLTTPINGTPLDIPDMLLTEQPWYLTALDDLANVDKTGAVVDDTMRALILGEVPATGANLNMLNYYARNTATALNTATVADVLQDYCPKGELVAAIDLGDGLGGTPGTTISITGLNSQQANTVEQAFSTALEAPGNAMTILHKHEFQNLILLTNPADTTYDGVTETDVPKQEFMAVTDYTRTGNDFTLDVRRGMGDTPPQAWAIALTEVWFVSAAPGRQSIDADLPPGDQTADADLLTVALLNRTNTGNALVANMPTRGMTFVDRANKPLPAGDVEINGLPIPILVAIDGDVDITWNHRNRLSVDPALNLGAGRLEQQYWEDANAKDLTDIWTGTPTHEYRLEIYDDLLSSLERTVTQSTTGFNYTNALQITDGGPFARLRLELRARLISGGAPFNLVDIIRIVNVTIPLSFTARGPLYYAALERGAALIYAANEDFPMDAAAGGSGQMTEVGEVGHGAPGPFPVNTFLAFGGDDVGGGWMGNAEIPDDPELDQIQADGWMTSFSIRCVRDAQTNRRNILIHDTAAAAPTVGYYFGTHLFSGVDGQMTWYWQGSASSQPTAGHSSARRFLDDGKWHKVILFKPTTAGGTVAVMIDGSWAWIKAGSSMVGGTDDYSIGGYSGLSGWGFQKMHFGMFASKDADDTVANLARSSILTQPWTPWVSMAAKFASYTWGRGNSQPNSQGQQVIDWSLSERNPDDPDFSLTLNNKTTPIDGVANGSSGTWDAFAHDSPILDGGPSNKAADLGGNGFRCGNDFWPSKNVQGPQEYASFAMVNPDSFPAATESRLWTFEAVNLGSEVTNSEVYSAWIDDAGFVRVAIRHNAGNHRVHRTDAQCVFVTEWNYIWLVNRITDGWECWVNGIEFSMDSAFDTLGTPPAVDELINNRNNGGTLNNSLYHTFGNGRASSAIPPTSNAADDWPGIAAEYGESLVLPAAKDIRILYAATLKPFPTMRDVLLDFDPTHVFQVLDNADVDLRGVLTTLTATGTFPTDEEVPLPSDDETMPQRFNGAERMRYTDAAFKGTGQLDNWAFILIAQIWDSSADMTFFANHRADDAATATNFSCLWDLGSGQPRVRGNGEFSNNGTLVRDQGGVFCFAVSHTDSAPGDEMKHFVDGEVAYKPAVAMAAPADTMGEFSIGARGTAVEDLNGNVHYLALYDYTAHERVIRRAQLKYRGMNGQLLEIHSHMDTNALADEGGDGFLFPLADADQSASGAENWVINDATIQNMILTGAHTALREAIGALGVPLIAQYATGNYVSGEVFNGGGTYPYTLGAWVRVDSGTDAMVSLSNSAETDEFIAVGIIGGNAAARIAVGATSADEAGSTTVTAGDMAFVAMTFISDVSRKLYLNGELETEFTTSRDVDTQVLAKANTAAVNRIVGPDTDFVGSYQMFFGVEKELTDAHHRVIYREGQHFGWRGLTVRDGAIAQWLLDEPSEFTAVFRDQFNDDYNALEVSTGVTQDAAGLLPSAPGICVDLDGANDGIDTNWLGYPTGTTNRMFECWLEGGWVGTVCSMGANTDANALVVSVDGSGDVSIHIRGAGNERIWTTALDLGIEHHLIVELNGDSLHDFNIWIDGVAEVTIGTAGTDTVLATTATLDLHIGQDITDIGKADGNGRIYGFTVYDAGPTPFSTNQAALRNSVGRDRITGQS